MVKYSQNPKDERKTAKAAGEDLRVHYKNTYEVINVIRYK